MGEYVAITLPNPKPMPKLEVRGRVHPPPHKDPKYKGWEHWASEVDTVIPEYVGKPVFINHEDTKTRVGQVKKMYKEKTSGCIVTDLTLDPTDQGMAAMKDVISGKLKGLSLGYSAYENPVTKGRIGRAIPKEISLCEVGAMPDTLIFAFQVDDVVAVSAEKAKSIYTSPPVSLQNSLNKTRMTTTEQEAAQASAMTSTSDQSGNGLTAEMLRYIEIGKQAEAKKVNDLRDMVLNKLIPAYNSVIAEHPEAGLEGLPAAMEELMQSPAGQVVLRASGMLGGNYIAREKVYAAKDEEVKKLMEERQKLEASKVALSSEDERKVASFGFGSLIHVANSGSASSAPVVGEKRMKFADAFIPNNKSLSDMRSEFKNSIARGDQPPASLAATKQ